MVSFLLKEINPHSLRLINISAIRSGLCSFPVIMFHMMIFTMMNTAVFLLWELLEQLFFNECKEKAVREYHIFNHFQNRSAYLRLCRSIRVSHSWKTMNWLSIAMISLMKVSSKLSTSKSIWWEHCSALKCFKTNILWASC